MSLLDSPTRWAVTGTAGGLAKLTSGGVPRVSLILAFIAGLIFFLPFPGWPKLVGFVTSSRVLSFGAGPIVLLTMRTQLPNHEQPFRLKGVWVIAFLALWSSNLIVYWSGWATDWKLFLAILFGFILLRLNQLSNRVHTPPLDFKPGRWMVAWFAGLALISYLGSYPDPATGNLGIICSNRGILVIFRLSLLIVWLGYKSRLPTEQVEEELAQTSQGEEPPAPLAE